MEQLQPSHTEKDSEPQENFVENRNPTEMAMCLILASAYLGLAKYCWQPLLLAHNWKLLINVEGFFITIALIAILMGARPYLNPTSLQISPIGIKYRGPYWSRRKTVNWNQVQRIYVSSELVIVLYRPKLESKRVWPMLISSLYLADRENLAQAIITSSPVVPVIMTNPALPSRIAMGVLFLIIILWILEMVVN